MGQLSLSRFFALLNELKHKAVMLDEQNRHRKSHHLLANEALFSQDLFRADSDNFLPYIEEVSERLTKVESLCEQGRWSLVNDALPLIEQQMIALSHAINADQARHHDASRKLLQREIVSSTKHNYQQAVQAVVKSSQELYQSLSEHHEFERRLATMIAERDTQRATASGDLLNKITQEILALHKRLGRCRQAISAIELDIERAEKRN